MASEENEHPLTVDGGSPSAQVHRRLRSARRLVEHRRQRQRRHDRSRSFAATPTRLRRDVAGRRCCSPAPSKSPPATSSMAPRRCWSTRAGNGVHGFTLDPAIGAYVLSHENIRMPAARQVSTRERGLLRQLSAGLPAYIVHAPQRRDRPDATPRATSARWSPTSTARCSKAASSSIRRPSRIPDGKLRLLYEANPIAFIAEQAGGLATRRPPPHPRHRARQHPPAHAAGRRRPGRDAGVRRAMRGRVTPPSPLAGERSWRTTAERKPINRVRNVSRPSRAQECHFPTPRAAPLPPHPADEHHGPHLPIGDERPQRILERGRLVLLDEEVPEPGEAIAHDRRRHQQPRAVDDRRHHHPDRQRAAHEVHARQAGSECSRT